MGTACHTNRDRLLKTNNQYVSYKYTIFNNSKLIFKKLDCVSHSHIDI